MTHDLPPLPEPSIVSFQLDSTMRRDELRTFGEQAMRDYALAAIAPYKAELDAIRGASNDLPPLDHCRKFMTFDELWHHANAAIAPYKAELEAVRGTSKGGVLSYYELFCRQVERAEKAEAETAKLRELLAELMAASIDVAESYRDRIDTALGQP